MEYFFISGNNLIFIMEHEGSKGLIFSMDKNCNLVSIKSKKAKKKVSEKEIEITRKSIPNGCCCCQKVQGVHIIPYTAKEAITRVVEKDARKS